MAMKVDLEDLGTLVSTEQVEVEAPAEQSDGPRGDPAELDRYRAAFRRLFDRSLAFVGSNTKRFWPRAPSSICCVSSKT